MKGLLLPSVGFMLVSSLITRHCLGGLNNKLLAWEIRSPRLRLSPVGFRYRSIFTLCSQGLPLGVYVLISFYKDPNQTVPLSWCYDKNRNNRDMFKTLEAEGQDTDRGLALGFPDGAFSLHPVTGTCSNTLVD